MIPAEAKCWFRDFPNRFERKPKTKIKRDVTDMKPINRSVRRAIAATKGKKNADTR
jgi:hypothetical protein